MVVRSALPGIAVVRFQGRVGSGFPCEMTLHVRQATDIDHTAAGLAGLAAACGTWWGSAGVRALFTTGSAQDQVTVQDLSPTRFASPIVAVGTAGTRVGTTPAATQDSLVLTSGTGLSGRAFRGRMYTWGAYAVDLDAAGGLWDASFASAWTTQGTALLSAIATAAPVNYKAILWHRAAGQGGVPAEDSVTVVTSLTGRVQLGVQRSRRS